MKQASLVQGRVNARLPPAFSRCASVSCRGRGARGAGEHTERKQRETLRVGGLKQQVTDLTSN